MRRKTIYWWKRKPRRNSIAYRTRFVDNHSLLSSPTANVMAQLITPASCQTKKKTRHRYTSRYTKNYEVFSTHMILCKILFLELFLSCVYKRLVYNENSWCYNSLSVCLSRLSVCLSVSVCREICKTKFPKLRTLTGVENSKNFFGEHNFPTRFFHFVLTPRAMANSWIRKNKIFFFAKRNFSFLVLFFPFLNST